MAARPGGKIWRRSGVGMLDEGCAAGIEHAIGRRARVVGYCERDAYAASTLVARMEGAALDHAPIWNPEPVLQEAREWCAKKNAELQETNSLALTALVALGKMNDERQ